MSAVTITVPAEEKARRYRRKLSDLVEKIEAWNQKPGMETHQALVEEAIIVKSQLEAEEKLQQQTGGAKDGVETETTTDPWQTAIRIKGSFAAVTSFVEDYMRRFCTTNYRTHVVKREELSDGR